MHADVLTASTLEEGRANRLSGRNVIMLTIVVTSLLTVLAGIAMIAAPWVSFHRYHLEELIPNVATLAILRWGPWGAASTATFFVTAIEHNRALFVGLPARNEVADNSRVRGILYRRFGLAAVFAAVVPVLYGPVTALAFASSMVTAKVCLGLRPSTFFELVEAGDAPHGVLLALLFGCVPAGWSLLGMRLTRASHRGIAFKLLMTWFVMLGFSFGVRLVLGLLGDE